ncbi:MAG: CCA tRNA nucleotidyltransferase [Nitrososphaerota archaeon]|nr:CCA tRNA nucleotidyltransferase [Nitrososphaerota archaeon]
MDPILSKALATVRPTHREEEALRRKADFILARTMEAAKGFQEVKQVLLGGSFAKGTWLRGRADLDVFLKLDSATLEQRFEEIGLRVGAEATEGYPRGKKFAQHPYTEAEMDGVKVNIVPCYDVRPKEWKSAADRSPFHVELVSAMPEAQKDQVRLLKMWMQGVGVYGAEIEVQGFSGYAAEVLVMTHRSFLGVLRYFADLGRVDSERLLQLPDPVDPGRDLARAISNQKVGELVFAARKFLSSPSMKFFGTMRGRARPAMKKAAVAIVFSHRKLSEDTLWGELRRTIAHVRNHAEEEGFTVARAVAASNSSDRSALIFLPEFDRLSSLEQKLGPTVERKAATEAFLRANSRDAKLIWVDEEGRLRILRERKHTDLKSFLSKMVGSGVRGVGASESMARGLARSGKVLSGSQLARAAASAPWLREGLERIASDTIGTSSS